MAGNFSHLVTNAQMKKVLSDVAHLNSTRLGRNYTLTKISHHACTSGPATWYGRAGLHLTFWNGAQPFMPGNKYYKKGKRSATVEDMKAPLIKAGFQIVWSGTGQQANSQLASSEILRPGDVATMLSKDSAHAAMWTGQDWRSDFLQDDKPYPYSSVGRGGNETFILWRHPKFQDDSVQTNQPQSTPVQPPKQQLNTVSREINWRSEKPETRGGHIPKSQEYINTNALSLINFLQQKGLTLTAALGVAGNIMSESHFNPYAYNSNDNGGPSGGLAQWHDKYTGDRKCYNLTNLKKYAKSVGKNWTDIQTQADYLWLRISKTRGLIDKLNSAESVERASFLFGDLYERFQDHDNPETQTHKDRAQHARDLRVLYKNTYGEDTQDVVQPTPNEEKQEPVVPSYAKTQQDSYSFEPLSVESNNNTDQLPLINLNSDFSYNLNSNYNRFPRSLNLDTLPIIANYDLMQDNNFEVEDSENTNYVDYFDVISNFIKRNPLRFQKGGSTNSLFDKVKRKEWPKPSIVDYQKIINAVYNQGDNSFGDVTTGENSNEDLISMSDIYRDYDQDVNIDGKIYSEISKPPSIGEDSENSNNSDNSINYEDYEGYEDSIEDSGQENTFENNSTNNRNISQDEQTKGLFIYNFMNSDKLYEYNIKIANDDRTLLKCFKQKLNSYLKGGEKQGISRHELINRILNEDPHFKKYLVLGFYQATYDDVGDLKPDYNLKNPYEKFPESVRGYIDPLIEMYQMLLEEWRNKQAEDSNEGENYNNEAYKNYDVSNVRKLR